MSYQPGVPLSQTDTVPMTDTTLFATSGTSPGIGQTTALSVLTWLESQGADLSALTVLTALPSDGSGKALLFTSAGAALVPVTLLGSNSGSTSNTSSTSVAATTFSVALSAASGVTGSQVTMTVTPGSGGWPSNVTVTPTASSVSGAFSPTSATPSGTTAAIFTFTSSGTGTGTLNASATGMTSNGGQTYTATASGGGSTYPAMTFSGVTPSFETASPIYGAASLKIASAVGSAVINLTAPANNNGSGQINLNISFPFKGGATFNKSEGNDFLIITDSAGHSFGLSFSDTGEMLRAHAPNASYQYGSATVRDGALHYVQLFLYENYNNLYWGFGVDGTRDAGASSSPFLTSGALTVNWNFANMVAGDLIDNILIESDVAESGSPAFGNRTTAAPRGANTLALIDFDGQNGAGS